MKLDWNESRQRFWLGPLCFCLTASLLAAPKSSRRSDDNVAEVPAVPYVTLALIRDASVHNELKLSPPQIAAVEEAIAVVDEMFWQLREVPVADCALQLEALQSKLRRRMNEELTIAQRERFDQLVLQRRSWHGLASPEMAKRLDLSTDQTTKLRTALKKCLKEHESIESKMADQPILVQEQARAKQRKLDVQTFEMVLTSKQRDIYLAELGAGFDFSRLTPVGCVAPELRSVEGWINTSPVTLKDLRGKVVVVHFWAFGCINCIRNLPHYQRWSEDFSPKNVTILGVHTPETEQERMLENLRVNVNERNIQYPVIFDGRSENWKAWGNNVWPSVYLIDKRGRVRYWWYGELNWKGARGEELFRRRIQELVEEKER